MEKRLERHIVALAQTGIHDRAQIRDITGATGRRVWCVLARHKIVVPDRAQSPERRKLEAMIDWDTQAGIPTTDTAARLGLSPRTVRSVRERMGITAVEVSQRQSRRADRIAAVVTLTRQGMSAVQIADVLGIYPRQVVRDRLAGGVAKPAILPVDWTDDLISRATELLADGAGYAETAATLGIGAEPLSRRFPGYGLTQAQAQERGKMSALFRKIPASRAALDRPTTLHR